MAAEYWEIQSIEKVWNQHSYSFTFVMDGPTGILRIPVTGEALLDYRAGQRELLKIGGMVYRLEGCEGRAAQIANELWRRFTQKYLDIFSLKQAVEQMQARQNAPVN